MAKEQKMFADDGWAVWVEGEDVSTVYINDWLNPKGKSFVDLAVRIRGVLESKALLVYVPFAVTKEEIEDVSLLFQDTNIVQATFSASCIIEYQKNAHTSEIAYNGKTVDLVHISTLNYQASAVSEGTLLSFDLEALRPYLDNDEAYFIWRMPHKSLDAVFAPRKNMGKAKERLIDLITSPIINEKFGYSIRINESRLLPESITKMPGFHRQKLEKALITLSVHEDYELNDAGCSGIRRLEENLYKEFLPKGYKSNNVITYQWQQNRERNFRGHFNFYYTLAKNSISRGSMCLYLILLTVIGVAGDLIAALLCKLLGI